jgi:hypothetical protein
MELYSYSTVRPHGVVLNEAHPKFYLYTLQKNASVKDEETLLQLTVSGRTQRATNLLEQTKTVAQESRQFANNSV